MLAELYKLPEVKINNCIFKNNGDLIFTNKSNEWGLDEKTFSNGAVYADLDNDGNLDLVFNNMDDEAGIYKNNINKNETINVIKNNFIKFQLKSNEKGNEAVGAKIKIPYLMEKIYINKICLSEVLCHLLIPFYTLG